MPRGVRWLAVGGQIGLREQLSGMDGVLACVQPAPGSHPGPDRRSRRVILGQIGVSEGHSGPDRSFGGSFWPEPGSRSSFRVWDGEDRLPEQLSGMDGPSMSAPGSEGQIGAKTGYFWSKWVNFQRPRPESTSRAPPLEQLSGMDGSRRLRIA